MSTHKPSSYGQRAIFVAATLLALWAVVIFYTGDPADIAMLGAEYGSIEIIELCIIIVCLAIFCDAYMNSHGALRYAAGALALLAATAFVREVDVKKLAGPVWYRWIAERGLQEVLFVGMSLIIFAYLWRHRRHSREFFRLLTRWYAWPLFAAGALILIGQFIDRRVKSQDPRLDFVEAIAELLGYLFLTVAALRHRALTKSGFFK